MAPGLVRPTLLTARSGCSQRASVKRSALPTKSGRNPMPALVPSATMTYAGMGNSPSVRDRVSGGADGGTRTSASWRSGSVAMISVGRKTASDRSVSLTCGSTEAMAVPLPRRSAGTCQRRLSGREANMSSSSVRGLASDSGSARTTTRSGAIRRCTCATMRASCS